MKHILKQFDKTNDALVEKNLNIKKQKSFIRKFKNIKHLFDFK